MNKALPLLLTLILLLSIFAAPITTLGQEIQNESDQNATTDEPEDDSPVQRVARLSFVQGDVSFLRAGVKEWASAVENLPLLAGDQIYAGRAARAEVQLGRGNYIRLSENTALTITELSDSESQFEITEGIAIIRIERLQTAFGRFEVDTPNAALTLQQDGLYRVNVRGDEDSEVIVRQGAAEVSTLDGSFKVREGHKLLVDTSAKGRLEIALDDSRDDWDQWSYDRDVAIDRTSSSLSPDYVNSYETDYSDFYGASDLSSYGSWTNDSSYGYCWRPRVDYGWVPYRDGQWLWLPNVGWSWLSNEPWGWAPYHYGRWAFSNTLGWVWIPGFSGPRYPRYNRSYYRWRPALVFFFDFSTSRDRYVGWYPLAPGERWRNLNRRGVDHSHLQYPIARDGWRRPDNGRSDNGRDGRAGIRPPRDARGVSLIPVDGFTRPDRARVRPVAPDKDLRDWIGKGARPGLPEITPTPIASAPSLREGSDSRRRIAIPANEIINRPVVTRNRPKDAQIGISAPRERRLILPRNPAVSLDPSEPKERGNSRNEDRSNGRSEDRRPKPPAVAPREGQDQDDSNRAVRNPRPMPANHVDNDELRSERKDRRDKEDSAAQRPVENKGGSDKGGSDKGGSDADNSSGERQRKEPIYLPTPRQSDPASERPARNEDQQRERKPRDEERSRPKEAAPPREDRQRNSEEHPKPRENEQPAQRNERPQPPPQQNREQPREERQQPKQERQQERQQEREQQRRKP
jgi:uncharacterized protein DUF6600/FecR-like protein